MTSWTPDKASDVAVYKQIVDYIKTKIANGQWTVGTKLPSQRQLAQTYGVNRSTIVEALDILKSEGLIDGYGRRGTVVINNSWSLMASNPPPNWNHYIESGMHWSNQSTIQAINKLEFQPGMIRLGTGELSTDLYPKKMMEEVLMKVGKNLTHLGYEAPKGSFELRRAICGHLSQSGIEASPENVLIVSGSLQALQLISLGILHAGSNVYLEKPSYLKSLNIFQSAGMNLCGIDMDDEGVDLSDLKKKYNMRKTSLLYTIPTYHNPTGRVMSEKRRGDLLDFSQKNRLPLIEDDAYRELWLDTPPPKPLKAMDQTGNVLYMGTVSKALAPGIRIGWLIGPESVMDRLGDIKMQTDYGASSISQAVLTEWFKGGYQDAYIKTLRKALRQRRHCALEALEKYMSGLATWEKPQGGFYIWLKLKRALPMKRLFKRAAEDNLLINPGQIYDFDDNQYIRISYAYASESELDRGLKKLAGLIEDLQD